MPMNPSGRGVQPRQPRQPKDNTAGLGGGSNWVTIVGGNPSVQGNPDLNGSSNARNRLSSGKDTIRRIAGGRAK